MMRVPRCFGFDNGTGKDDDSKMRKKCFISFELDELTISIKSTLYFQSIS